MTAAYVLGLAEHVGGLRQRTDLQHARLAWDDGEVAAKQKSAAGLGLAAGAVGDDKVRLLAEHRQFVQDDVGIVEADGPHLGPCLPYPLGRRLLGIAIGERDAVALVKEPRGKVDGKRGLADPALGVRDDDDHASTDSTIPSAR